MTPCSGFSDGRIVAHTEYTPVRISSSRYSAGPGRHLGACRGRAFPVWRSYMAGNRLEVGAWVSTCVEQAGGWLAFAPLYRQQLCKSAMASGIRQAEGDSLSDVGFETDGSGQVSVTTDGKASSPMCRMPPTRCLLRCSGKGIALPRRSKLRDRGSSKDMPQRLTFQEHPTAPSREPSTTAGRVAII